MKRLTFCLLVPLLVLAAACSSSGPQSGGSSVPGHGALAIQVEPNPIVATRVSGDKYDFPFDVIVRETGGRPVDITRVTATVFGPGGMTVGRDTWDADRIRALGFNTTLPANGELRYHFSPRREVPDDRLFGGVSAELKVEGTDDTGSATSATTVVTVRR